MTSEPGYWMSEDDGRDLLTAIRTYRQAAEIWERTAAEMQAEVTSLRAEIDAEMKTLRDELNAERLAWKRKATAERNRTWLCVVGALGLGFVIGR